MARPFEGIRIIDITHVLAGPFAKSPFGLLVADTTGSASGPVIGS